ncbi:hypothetical protein AWV80_37140 [Cupriavidus sp. UYMU48A]|nr:hypothetical protein AWV80_37140 [Cupriavidus sp. UYMU48A]
MRTAAANSAQHLFQQIIHSAEQCALRRRELLQQAEVVAPGTISSTASLPDRCQPSHMRRLCSTNAGVSSAPTANKAVGQPGFSLCKGEYVAALVASSIRFRFSEVPTSGARS